MRKLASRASSPLPLWERVDRTAKRFETGEGFNELRAQPYPSSATAFGRATFSHKGRRKKEKKNQIALAAMLTISATKAVLNRNETMPCAVAVRRIDLSVMPTSEVCAVIPMTKAKYTKSQ